MQNQINSTKNDPYELVSQLPVPAFWKDDKGIYQICNQAYVNLLEFGSLSNIIGYKDSDLFCAIDAYLMQEHDKKVLSQSILIQFEENIKTIQQGKSQKIPKKILVQKIPMPDKTGAVGILGMSVDISNVDPKNAISSELNVEEERRKSAEYALLYFMKNTPGHFYWKNRDGVYLGCNDLVAKAAGFKDVKDIIGKTDHDVLSKEKADILRATDLRIMTTGIPETLEEPGIRGDGSIGVFITNKFPFYGEDGKIHSIMGYSNDITLQKDAELKAKKAEEVAAIARAKAEGEEDTRNTVMMLVGDIVHDQRTPIATVQVVADLLGVILPLLLEITEEANALGAKKINLLSKKQWNYMLSNAPVTSLLDSVSLMREFINSTLTELANVQRASGEDFTHMELTDHMMRRIVERTLAGYPLGNEIVIHKNLSYDFPFKGNLILMMKILFNLLKNSIEQITLNKKGDITICTEENEHMNILKIKDTGGGAHPDIIPNLFKGYFSTKKNGSGIGLAFCKKTMERFGGTLSCNSVYGEYMEFILSFPKVMK